MMDNICFKGRLTASYHYKKVKAPPPTPQMAINFTIACAEEKIPLHYKWEKGNLCLVSESLYHCIIKQKMSHLR